jgi:hypothetical protein
MLLSRERVQEEVRLATYGISRPENIFANLLRHSVSVGYLLASENPGAQRLICLGGAPPLLGQQPIQFADSVAQQIQKLLGLGEVKSSELTEGLLRLSNEDLLKLPPGQPLGAVIDGDIIPSEISLSVLAGHDPSLLPGSRTIKSILLGDSKLDVSNCARSRISDDCC